MFSEELYIEALNMSLIDKYLAGSAFTFLLCDMLSTIDDEIEFIWRSKWGWAKILYLISRYLGPVILLIMMTSGQPTDPFTEKRRVVFRLIGSFGCLASFIVVNVISSMRVYALYNRSRAILLLLIFLWACELTVGTYSIILIAMDFVRVLRSFPVVAPDSDVRAILLFGAVCTTSALTYLTLSLFKLRDSITDSTGRVRYEVVKDLSYTAPLAAAFISDGAFGFLLVFAIELANTIVMLDNIAYYYVPTFPFILAILCFVGTRFILNLRRTGRRGTTNILKLNISSPVRPGVHISTFRDGSDVVDPIRFASPANRGQDPDPFSASLQPHPSTVGRG